MGTREATPVSIFISRLSACCALLCPGLFIEGQVELHEVGGFMNLSGVPQERRRQGRILSLLSGALKCGSSRTAV